MAHPNDTENQEIETVTFEAGDILFEENETSFHFYIIQEGEVEIFKKGSAGDVVLAIVGPGNSIGEFAMLDRQPRSASARALSRLTAAKVSPHAYDRLLNDLPDWAVSVMRALVERLRFTNEVVRSLQRSKGVRFTEDERRKVDSAEFSDSDSRISKIREAEGTVEQVDTEFDFSVYDADSTSKKPPRAK